MLTEFLSFNCFFLLSKPGAFGLFHTGSALVVSVDSFYVCMCECAHAGKCICRALREDRQKVEKDIDKDFIKLMQGEHYIFLSKTSQIKDVISKYSFFSFIKTKR